MQQSTTIMPSLDAFARAKLAELEARELKRSLVETWRKDGLWVERKGKRLLSFSCNDYLNLSHHPEMKAAAREAVDLHGAGAGASRLVTGDHPLVEALERRIAAFKGTEAACVFGSGYLTNVGVVPTLARGPDDIVLVDELAHACLWAGASLTGAETRMFRHNDMAHLAEMLRESHARGRRALVLTDGVFSMDGDIAPLDRMAALCAAHDAWLMVDDAHALGVIGGGRGTGGLYPRAHVPLQMGTLSKALGSYGGYIAASRPVVDLIKTRARSFVYSTGLPPASAAAALKALDIVERDPALIARPVENARRFTRALDLPEARSAIVPIVLGDPRVTLDAAAALEEAGFLVVPIRPPTVPDGTARLRIAFTAGHDGGDIDRLADCVRSLLPP